MDFNINYDTVAGELEKFLRTGDEIKAREIILQLLENKIYFEIEVEEKINKPQPPPKSKIDPLPNNQANKPDNFLPAKQANNNENLKNKRTSLYLI